MKFYKSSLNFNNNKTTYKEFCRCLGTGFCSIWWFCFFEFLIPFTLSDHNFLNFIPFLTIFYALDAPIKGVQVFLDIKNNGTLPLDPTCL